jgi:cytochrome d ubiquinol oxidase subunit II
MDLPLLSAIFLAFALTLYVLLDGFDLGVGALLLVQRDERLRDRMVDAIAPVWDGNETWLIMAGVALLAAFPVAYGMLLPALYLPLVVMLLSLGIRGVSFEFRHQSTINRRRWDAAFAGGSVVAAAAQGVIIGALIQGIHVEGRTFGGSPFDVFTPFSALTAITSLAGRVTQGAGWLCLKGEPDTRRLARACLRWSPIIFLALAGGTSALAATVQADVAQRWREHPVPFFLLAASFTSCGLLMTRAARREDSADSTPFVFGQAMVALALVGLVGTVFPDIVPFRVSLWSAASGTGSQVFLLIGALVVTPVVLAYSAFAYWVFRGKTPVDGWDG